MRMWDYHVEKGLHSLRDNKVQGEGERERDERGLWLFLWELRKDLKNTDSNLH